MNEQKWPYFLERDCILHQHKLHLSELKQRNTRQQQSSSELDNHDGMSVRSATISGYRSEDSLALGGGSSASGMIVGLSGGGGGVGGSGRLGSLPSSPYVHQGGDGHAGGGGVGDGGNPHPHGRTSKSNSFSSHVRLHDKG